MRRATPCPARVLFLALGLGIGLLLAPPAGAQEDAAKKAAEEAAALADDAPPGDAVPAPAEAPVFDEVTLKDGSRIVGEIVELSGGALVVKTAFGIDEVVKVKWAEVTSLRTAKPVTWLLKDGTTVIGTAQTGPGGEILIRSDALSGPATTDMASIKAINPPKPLKITANVGFGGSVSRGNTDTKSMSLISSGEIRFDRHRIGARAIYNYSENDESGVTAQYGLGSLKYDFFLMDPDSGGDDFLSEMLRRTYIYANAFVEHDGVQDLRLRTAFTAGPGFQVIEKGDFEAEWAKGMELSVEGGVGYINEDYKRAEDQSGLTARWAVKFDWPFVPDRIALFHFHEGYPSIEEPGDLYIDRKSVV